MGWDLKMLHNLCYIFCSVEGISQQRKGGDFIRWIFILLKLNINTLSGEPPSSIHSPQRNKQGVKQDMHWFKNRQTPHHPTPPKKRKNMFGNILSRNIYIIIVEVIYQCTKHYARYLITICVQVGSQVEVTWMQQDIFITAYELTCPQVMLKQALSSK